MTIPEVCRQYAEAPLFVLESDVEHEGALARPETEIHFVNVLVGDLDHVEPPPPSFWWDGYLPAGVVTLLGAHGGTGKSMIALMLAVSVAMGLPLFGIPTKRGRVVFFSGEDGAEIIRYRLHWICRLLGVTARELDGQLHILDATVGDPTLFHEVNSRLGKFGQSTPTYDALRSFIEAHGIDVLIVDNASDTFDASEIDRARVRGFMRKLTQIAKARDGAVLLLAHVDKGTSRGDRQGSESYSGSTAWHNSARSRLFLNRNKDGGLTLEHQKANLGRMREPLTLTWPDGGVPQVAYEPNGFVQGIKDRVDLKTILKLLHTAYVRQEWTATDTRSRYNAFKVLKDEPGFPRTQPNDIFRMLREAENDGLIERETYKDRSRRPAERWKLTADGLKKAGIAASAAGAASSYVDAHAQLQQPAAACAASTAARGVGNVCATPEANGKGAT